MKKKSKLLLSLVLVLGLCLMGCGKSKESDGDAESSNTLGGKYKTAFLNSSSGDAASMANEMCGLGYFESELVTMDVEEGYLNGFDGDIKGFTKGTMFSPMIGSIPFVGYVFETENPDELANTLKSSANLGWNICTFADEMVCEVKGNLVLFMMVTNEQQ